MQTAITNSPLYSRSWGCGVKYKIRKIKTATISNKNNIPQIILFMYRINKIIISIKFYDDIIAIFGVY